MTIKQFLALLILLLFIFSCEKEKIIEKNSKDILIKSNKTALEIKSAKFEVSYEFLDINDEYKANIKIYANRVKREGYPFDLRLEYNNGMIAVYNGTEYRYFEPENKKIVYVTNDEYEPFSFIEGNFIYRALNMVLASEDESEKIKKSTDSISDPKIVKLDNKEYYFISKSRYFEEYDVYVISNRYYNTDNYLCIIDSTYQISGKDTVKVIFKINNLEINPNIAQNQFKLEPKDGIALEKYEYVEPKTIEIGQKAPDFELLDGNSQKVTLQSLTGKVVVLDFWGTWCVWCVKAMPLLENLRKEYEKNPKVEILGISCQEPKNADPVKFMKDKNIYYRTLLNGDEVAKKFGVSGFPTLFIIDKNGKVVYTKVGFSENLQEELSKEIKKNL
jgi:peroxiredoxin/outer membrane lipoprotein-sorting protein